MTDFISYIKENLLEKNSVLVPGLGLFEWLKSPAYINFSENKIYPPQRKLIFKKHTEDADNNLVEEFCRIQGKDFEAFKHTLSDFATSLWADLHARHSYILNDFGSLTIDANGMLAFSLESDFFNSVLTLNSAPVLDAVPIQRLKDKGVSSEKPEKDVHRPFFYPIVGLTFFSALTVVLILLFNSDFSLTVNRNISTAPYLDKSAPVLRADENVVEKTDTDSKVIKTLSPKDIIVGIFKDETNIIRNIQKLEKIGFEVNKELNKDGFTRIVAITKCESDSCIHAKLEIIRKEISLKAIISEN